MLGPSKETDICCLTPHDLHRALGIAQAKLQLLIPLAFPRLDLQAADCSRPCVRPGLCIRTGCSARAKRNMPWPIAPWPRPLPPLEASQATRRSLPCPGAYFVESGHSLVDFELARELRRHLSLEPSILESGRPPRFLFAFKQLCLRLPQRFTTNRCLSWGRCFPIGFSSKRTSKGCPLPVWLCTAPFFFSSRARHAGSRFSISQARLGTPTDCRVFFGGPLGGWLRESLRPRPGALRFRLHAGGELTIRT